MAYRCVTVSAEPNEEVMKKIYEVLNEEDGYFNTRFQLQFVGFQMDADTEFYINKVRNKVPFTGYFITPYDGVKHMIISSLIFPEGLDDQDIYIIY